MTDSGHLALRMDKELYITSQVRLTQENFKRENAMEEANTNGLIPKYTMKVIFSTDICMEEVANIGKTGPIMMGNGIITNVMERAN